MVRLVWWGCVVWCGGCFRGGCVVFVFFGGCGVEVDLVEGVDEGGEGVGDEVGDGGVHGLWWG